MDLQLKLFRLHTAGTYLFMIAQGIMDVEGIKALFQRDRQGHTVTFVLQSFG